MVAAPLGYVDATVIAVAERLHITDVATTDLKFSDMAQDITKIRPLARRSPALTTRLAARLPGHHTVVSTLSGLGSCRTL